MNNLILQTLQEEMNMSYRGGLYHKTQILMAYNTNRIEGSQLTEDQTRSIFETNTLFSEQDQAVNIDDIIETQNHFQVFDSMLAHAEDPLLADLIKQFHEQLKRGTSDGRKSWFKVGDYKLLPNEVGGHETTAPADVDTAITQLLMEYNNKTIITIEDIVDFHAKFEAIHPFQDGNGRVGRLIMFKECLKYNIMPFIIDTQHQAFYYRGLQEYQAGREKGYLIDTCLSAQDQYKAICKKFLPQILE